MTAAAQAAAADARALLSAVVDPEIPVLTIDDLGILRDIRVADSGAVEVDITPTYSGCPAIDAIRDDVSAALRGHGYEDVAVRMVLSPAWTTDWMSEDGRRKLREYGIAPPSPRRSGPVPVELGVPVARARRGEQPRGVACPQCGSLSTTQTARFASTACKSLWRCESCAEPFDHFKTL